MQRTHAPMHNLSTPSTSVAIAFTYSEPDTTQLQTSNHKHTYQQAHQKPESCFTSLHFLDSAVDACLQVLGVGLILRLQPSQLAFHGSLDLGLVGEQVLQPLELVVVNGGSRTSLARGLGPVQTGIRHG